MAAQRKVEYLLLQYAPYAASNAFLNVGVLLFTPKLRLDGFCQMRFVPDWENRIRLFHPDADIELLAAMFREIERRMEDADQRVEMLRTMEDSFSNTIRVSRKHECCLDDSDRDNDLLIQKLCA